MNAFHEAHQAGCKIHVPVRPSDAKPDDIPGMKAFGGYQAGRRACKIPTKPGDILPPGRVMVGKARDLYPEDKRVPIRVEVGLQPHGIDRSAWGLTGPNQAQHQFNGKFIEGLGQVAKEHCGDDEHMGKALKAAIHVAGDRLQRDEGCIVDRLRPGGSK